MLINQEKLSPANRQTQAELEEIDESSLAAMKRASLPPAEENANEKSAASTVVTTVTPTKSPASAAPITPTKSPATAAKTLEQRVEEDLRQTDLAVERQREKDWERHAAGYDIEEEEEEMGSLEEPKTNENTAKPPVAPAAKPAAMSTEDEDPSNGIATFIQANMGTVGETHAFCLLLYTCYL